VFSCTGREGRSGIVQSFIVHVNIATCFGYTNVAFIRLDIGTGIENDKNNLYHSVLCCFLKACLFQLLHPVSVLLLLRYFLECVWLWERSYYYCCCYYHHQHRHLLHHNHSVIKTNTTNVCVQITQIYLTYFSFKQEISQMLSKMYTDRSVCKVEFGVLRF
jgi:hypothetical protein